MQALPSRPRLDQIALKWHDLAQRRLEYYTELYRSGRWRHYYSQERFAERMLDVIAAARKFAELAGQPHGTPNAAGQPLPPAVRNDEMRPAA